MFGKKKKSLKQIQKEIEQEFNNGNIVLPTSVRDYEDFQGFKEKTAHLPIIQNKLRIIEGKSQLGE